MNEELKNEILNLGSDNITVFGGKYEGGIHLQQNIVEITGLIEFLFSLNKKFESFLEVGSAAGGNTFILNKYFNFDNVVIIDNNEHSKHHLRSEILKDVKRVEYIGDSQSKESNEWIKKLNIKFDLIFIDADHSYEGVKNDTYNYIEFLKNGGYLIFHDTYYCSGIVKWCEEIKNGGMENLQHLIFLKDEDNKWPKGISVFQKNI